MKKTLISTIALFLFITLIVNGCSTDSTSQVQQPVAKDTEVPEVAKPAEAVEPAEQPTETPEPVYCNIVFDTDRDGNREVYMMGPDGNNLSNLTNNPADDWNPAFSPDGSQVAFVSNRETEQGSGQHVYSMTVDGANLVRLSDMLYCDSPDWSHDGSQITFTCNDDVMIAPSGEGGEAINLTNSPEKDTNPTWSPDGSMIAWISENQVMVMNADGTGARAITENSEVGEVQWSVDGDLVFFDPTNAAGCANCVMSVDKEVVGEFDKGNLQEWLPFWTADGKKVQLVDGDGEIFLGGEEFPDFFLNLTNNPANDGNPSSPANCGPVSEPVADNNAASLNPQPINPDEIVIGYEGDVNSMPQQKIDDLLKACEELNIQCVQGSDISELAGQDVNAIISFSNQWHVQGSGPQTLDATRAGIPVYVLNAESNAEGTYNFSIESESARADLEWMFAEMGDEEELAYFNFNANQPIADVLTDVLEEHPGIKTTEIPSDIKKDTTEEDVAAFVTAHPDLLGAIWANERRDNIFWGINAIPDSQSLPLIMCDPISDRLQNWKSRLDAMPFFKCRANIAPGGVAYEAVYVAYYMLTGEQLDPAALGGIYGNTFLYDYPVILDENLDEWLGKLDELRQTDGGPLESNPMTPEEIKEKWFLE
jgi:hypothetical protein